MSGGGGFERKPGGTSLVQQVQRGGEVPTTPGKRTLTEQLGNGAPTSVQRQAAPAGATPAPATAQGSTSAPGADESTASAQPVATKLAPEDVAAWLARRPDLREDILEWANRVGGAAYVGQVLAAEKHGAAATAPRAAAATSAPVTATPTPATPAPATALAVPGLVRVSAPEGLRVRRSPSKDTSDNVAGGLHHGTTVTALAREGEWLRIEYQGAPAYVFAAFVEAAGSAAGQSAAGAGQGGAEHAAHAPASSSASISGTAASSSASAPAVHAPAVHADAGHADAGHAPMLGPPAPAVHTGAAVSASATFTTLTGNTLASTTQEETVVLMALRRDQRRLDPQWLALAQVKLGVIDATGAFNTETLRAMRTRSGRPKLDAQAILEQAFLLSIEPGEPFASAVEGYGDYGSVDPAAKTPADRAAQAVGYASYEAYWGILEQATFLGRSLKQGSSDGRVHPYLAARLRVAEGFLRQRHPGGDEAVIRAIGWNGVIGGAYADTEKATHDAKDPKSHMHTMGLAVDVDAGSNPYLFGGDGRPPPADLTKETTANWLARFYEDTSRVAARVYGGDALAPGSLMQTSQRMSTEELHAHVMASSNAFKQYVELSEQPTDAIVRALVEKGYSESEARAELPRFAETKKIYHDSKGGRKYHQVTNISMDMLVALRDAAGLAWGGTEMSTIQNGDFMHFDCRNDEFGYAVYSKTTPKGRGPGKKK